MKKIRILIAEDHKLIRETWTSMLNYDDRFEVVAACMNTAEAISMAPKENPDIILMDINITPFDGFEATSRLSAICPNAKVIGLSFHNEMLYVQKMFAAGAKGYITKNSGCEEMTDAIIHVQAGNRYICAEIREKGFDLSAASVVRQPMKTIPLTKKEIQISDCIKAGLRSKEIAGKLQISVRTVGVHRYNIFRKLNVNSSASMVSVLYSQNG
jgi:DNA-binding NarL/FixJ family response regulator